MKQLDIDNEMSKVVGVLIPNSSMGIEIETNPLSVPC